MLDPGNLAPYFGFTNEEVKSLCQNYHKNFEEVKHWYDGYLLGSQRFITPKQLSA